MLLGFVCLMLFTATIVVLCIGALALLDAAFGPIGNVHPSATYGADEREPDERPDSGGSRRSDERQQPRHPADDSTIVPAAKPARKEADAAAPSPGVRRERLAV